MGGTCVSCGRENAAGRRFCTGCGAGLTLACPSCAGPIEAGDRFCGQCGHSLTAPAAPSPGEPARPAEPAPVEAERKQLTVLFASVRGATDREADLDSEEWAAVMDQYLRILQDGVIRFGGRVDKFTGDGLMALFGAPLALEDHAHRACWAAVEMLERAAIESQAFAGRGLRFDVRIGLNSGEAVVGRVGGDLAVDPTALGHTVGLAQRMQSVADAGQTVLTEHTARLVRATFALADLGPRMVKGSREPIGVFRLEGLAAAGTAPVPTTTTFVGRSVEIALLEQALAQADRGQAQIVGVAGEAGMGKTRLCHEFCDSVASRGIAVVRTAGVAYGKSVPWLPTLRLLRNYFHIEEGDSPAQAREKVSARLLALDPGFGDDLPLLFDFLEVKDPERPSPLLSSEVRLERILQFLARLTATRSHRETLVILVEDFHWFDPQSALFLERWLGLLHGSRTLVIVNFRHGARAAWMRHASYQRISLDPLSGDEAAEMLQDTLGDDPSLGPLLALVGERCGGNPFFLQEVVRAMVEEGTLSGGPGAYRLDRALDQVRVPPTVHAVLAARIDRLVADQKSLLQTASVIGRTFAEPLLARIAEMADQEMQLALRGLCAAELVQPSAGQATVGRGVAEYRFWHALTQEVAYDTQLASRRKRLHGAVAQALELVDPARQDENAAVLAWHWERAGDLAQAAKWSLRAADYVLRTDIVEAVKRLEQVVAIVDGLERTPAVMAMGVRARLRLVQLRSRLGRPRAESELLAAQGREMAEALGDIGLRGMMSMVAGSPHLWAGDPRGAMPFYREASELADQTDNPDLKAALQVGLPITLGLAGPLPEALAASERLLADTDGNPGAGVPVLGYSCLVVAWFFLGMVLSRTGRLVEAGERLEQAITLGRQRNDPEMLAWSLAFTCRRAWLAGLTPDLGLASEAVRIGQETGNTASEVLGREGEALAHLAAGDPGQAADACSRGLEECRTRRSGLFVESMLLDLLGQARLELGDTTGALAAADEAVEVARRQGVRVSEGQALLGRARVRHATGAPREAVRADLDAASELARDIGYAALDPIIDEERGRLLDDTDGLRRALAGYQATGATGRAASLQAELEGLPA
ncbi:MAG: hypothetical protein QOH36_1057 [Actinomycetota bacterium]|nr:hypothetical protein [Actinomycetota bacterium]